MHENAGLVDGKTTCQERNTERQVVGLHLADPVASFPNGLRRLRPSLSRSCPLLQIDAFQGHHKRPWTITQRQFANNLQALCRPAAFFMAPFLLLPSNAPGDCFLAVFVAGAVFRCALACSMWRDMPVWNSL
jgi:hypothetical protein